MQPFEIILPSAIDIERMVLASLFDKKIFDRHVIDFLPDYFFKAEHRAIFEYMFTEQIYDITLITEKFPSYTDVLADITESAGRYNLRPYIDILRDRYERREIMSAALDAINSAGDDFETTIDDIKSTLQEKIAVLYDIRKKSNPEMLRDITPRVFQVIDNIKTGATGFIRTGLYDVDEIIGPMCDGELIIIAARPGMGKSSLAASILRHNSIRQKIPTLWFTLEMDKIMSGGRIIFSEADTSYDAALKAKISADDLQKTSIRAEEIKDAPIIIDETPAISLNEILLKSKIQKQLNNIRLIVIDHMQLIGSSKGARSRNEDVAIMSAGLKTLARTLSLPVISLSQLSRLVEQRHPPRPILSDLRDSGAIEQDADKVIFLFRPEVYDRQTDKKGICEVIVGKNRNGPIGYREVCFDERTMNFYSKAQQNATQNVNRSYDFYDDL